DVYVVQSIANFRKSLFVPADRGVIKDSKGRTLVDNRPSFDVFLTPAFCKGKERDEVIEKLQDYLHLGQDDVERIKSDYQKSWFSKDKLERFKPYLVMLDIPRDQVDVLEALIPENERLVPATPGNNLVLSVDEKLQRAADLAFPGRAGAVVAMEAKTGFILAMVSRPSFDSNKMSGRISRAELKAISEDPLKPMLNRVMNENYHPGSTFKTIISFAGLESSAITAGSTVFCGGGYTMGNHRWRCDKAQGHGLLDMKHALARSCDV